MKKSIKDTFFRKNVKYSIETDNNGTVSFSINDILICGLSQSGCLLIYKHYGKNIDALKEIGLCVDKENRIAIV